MLNPSYISFIPEDAREEDVTHKHGAGPGRSVKNYYRGGSFVGKRIFYRDGKLETECSYKKGKRHGWEYHWNENGGLSSSTPFEDGREHGTACQWGESRDLIGSYTMVQGTGIDLWWDESEGKAYLSEARIVVDNLMAGYEYWFGAETENALWIEKWWSQGNLHGIEREWNSRGKLRRGFPKYWIQNKQVDKRAYLRAAKKDETLKPFLIKENQPDRIFPPEVAVNLR